MLRKELSAAHTREARNRKTWFQVFQDIQAKCGKKLAEKEKQLAAMEERALKAERNVEKLQQKVRQKIQEAVDVIFSNYV